MRITLLAPGEATLTGTATYYDWLLRWTAVARFLGYGGGSGTLTVHRALADPRAGGRPTTTRLHDLLLEALPPLNHPRVLDAGCGLGGTMLYMGSRIPGTFTGLTLSAGQAAIGRRAIEKAGLAGSMDIHVANYDQPPHPHYDLVVAIESLAHSHDPATSLDILASRLAPGGAIAIIDDMPTPAASGSADLDCFKNGWRLPVLLTADAIAGTLRAAGLTLVTDRDLSSEVRPRTPASIRRLELLNRAARRCTTPGGLRAMLDSYHGGLALERLFRANAMQYRMMVAMKAEIPTVTP